MQHIAWWVVNKCQQTQQKEGEEVKNGAIYLRRKLGLHFLFLPLSIFSEEGKSNKFTSLKNSSAAQLVTFIMRHDTIFLNRSEFLEHMAQNGYLHTGSSGLTATAISFMLYNV